MGLRIRNSNPKPPEGKTLADRCAETIGSWYFIGAQAFGLSLWIILNATLIVRADPYPFILLNLLLSTQAAFATPLLLLSANRQASIDRDRDIDHFNLDIRENETIEHIATQIDKIEKKLETVEDSEHF